MMLLFTLLAVGLSGPNFGTHQSFLIVAEGDSNTNNGFQNDSTYPQQLWWELGSQAGEYGVINVGKAGDTVYNMVNQAAAAIDIYDSEHKVCILWGGGNDVSVTVPGDSIARLVREFCSDRQAEGWHMIVMTVIHNNADCIILNDSIKANYASYADDIILIDEAPNIGRASNHSNTTYWWDVDHLTVLGAGIVADSVKAHIETFMVSERGYL